MYGVDGNNLYTLDVNVAGPPEPIPTNLVATSGEVAAGQMETPAGLAVFINALEFGSNGTLYGAGWDSTNANYIFSINTLTGVATPLISTGKHVSEGDIAFDANGDVFLTCKDGTLLEANPKMTTLTVVGNTKIADLTGLTFAPGSTMYGFETNYKVDSIDPTTGNATLVGQLVSPYLIGAVTITGCATYITPFQAPTVETGVGINVGQNASPTILNNIIANTETAVWVDATSSTTVLGANLYQNIVNPNINWGTGLGSFPISLASHRPAVRRPRQR